MKFKITGRMQYYDEWAVAYVDQQIAEYYRALVPKAAYIKPQRYPAHVTVVRFGMESPDKAFWGKYEGEQIPIEYENIVRTDGTYFWLTAWSPRIAKIRKELGLEEHRDHFKGYHITVGNTKVLVQN
jgi:hypothetical protein